jgi:hypothetical protein
MYSHTPSPADDRPALPKVKRGRGRPRKIQSQGVCPCFQKLYTIPSPDYLCPYNLAIHQRLGREEISSAAD